MKILKIISEHKKIRANPPPSSYRKPAPLKTGYKRVEAIIEIDGQKETRHIDILKV